MNLNKYLLQIKLNKEDPDYQIEDFWYGFKNSMIKFYKNCGFKNIKIEEWSLNLNKYKLEKKYLLIEENIKEYMIIYIIDVMQNEPFIITTHSAILLTNIKRWNKIAKTYNFITDTKYTDFINLYEAFSHIKKKCDENLFPILELFKNITNLKSDYYELVVLAIELKQSKLLDIIIKIIGFKKTSEIIKHYCPDLIKDFDFNIRGKNLLKRYNNQIINKI